MAVILLDYLAMCANNVATGQPRRHPRTRAPMHFRRPLAAFSAATLTWALASTVAAAELPTVPATATAQAGTTGFDGSVEALRHTVVGK